MNHNLNLNIAPRQDIFNASGTEMEVPGMSAFIVCLVQVVLALKNISSVGMPKILTLQIEFFFEMQTFFGTAESLGSY